MFSVNRWLLAALAVVCLGGCAAYSTAELTQLSRSGLPLTTLRKLEYGQPLDPQSLIDLRRHQIPNRVALRHLDRYGVDSLITRNDVIQMRNAGVSSAVIDEALIASDRFEERHSSGPYFTDLDAGFGSRGYYHGAIGFGWPLCF